MADLILTNGDSAADLLAAAGKNGLILPWRDVLNEGPIVGGVLAACTAARVPFLAERFGIPRDEIAVEFAARDAILQGHAEFDRIELWFEHDLYDQLQLVQILSCLADSGRDEGVILVQADDFLGTQTPDTILAFAERARPITGDDLDIADLVWADLAMPTPEAVVRHLAEPSTDLPFLTPALHRFLEELPAPQTGLSRTEATILAALARGSATPSDLFRAVLGAEEAPFMGDLSFFRILDDLAFGRIPLVAGMPPAADPGEDPARYRLAMLYLTAEGGEVLAGRADAISLNGIDRWWAGTHLRSDACWRFDRADERLVAPGFGA